MEKYVDDIEVFESPLVKDAKKAIEETLPGWKADNGPLCPGKAWHLTFRIVKDNEYKIVHVRESDLKVFLDGKIYVQPEDR